MHALVEIYSVQDWPDLILINESTSNHESEFYSCKFFMISWEPCPATFFFFLILGPNMRFIWVWRNWFSDVTLMCSCSMPPLEWIGQIGSAMMDKWTWHLQIHLSGKAGVRPTSWLKFWELLKGCLVAGLQQRYAVNISTLCRWCSGSKWGRPVRISTIRLFTNCG